VVLVDTFALPGGQYYKQTPKELGGGEEADRHVGRLLAGFTVNEDLVGLEGPDRPVRSFFGTAVWGIFPEEDAFLLCLYGPPGTPRRLRAKTLILAPGAYDRPLPFPGWTLPGVMTAGAALAMVKHQKVLPGRKVLLSGTGPLQLVLARHLLDGGAAVAAVLDANPFPWNAWKHAGAVWGQWERLQEGWEAWLTMLKAGVRIRWGHWVQRAEGNGQVEKAIVAPVRRPSNAGSQASLPAEAIDVDTICQGHGFTPSIQLSRLAGCEHKYNNAQGAYVPVRNARLETTMEGLFVVGDGAAIGGKDVARLEGQLAAIGATRRLGRAAADGKVTALRQELRRQRRFAAVLDALFPTVSGAPAFDLLTDDTVLCRCEEITVGEIRRAIGKGATTLSAIRMLTRAGMGRCQGRMCGGPVAELLSEELGRPVTAAGLATARPPVVPVPLAGLLEE
jgi:NADPH-dependent 2,4-dienoyl-CoA reductase/sulfur reductase-like enzyme